MAQGLLLGCVMKATIKKTDRSKQALTSCEQKKRDATVMEYMPLVKSIANKVSRRVKQNVSMDELISLGTTGLLQALSRYQEGSKASFKTFSYYRIRGAMLDGIGSTAPLSRKCYRQAARAGDLHAIYYQNIETDSIADPVCEVKGPENIASMNELSRHIEKAICKLSHKEQVLVRRHYFHNETLLDAGKLLGISKSWASRAHANALRNLKVELAKVLDR